MLLWRKMMDKMNTENFKILVEALEALPEEIKNNEVLNLRTNIILCPKFLTQIIYLLNDLIFLVSFRHSTKTLNLYF
jgi:hypothetical protein